MEKIKVLYIGDSEIVVSKYLLGVDVLEQSNFNDNGKFFREAMEQYENIDVVHINPHDVPLQFPKTPEELDKYNVLILSDVGYNSMIFYPGLKPPYEYPLGPDRVKMVKEFVKKGGGFIMVGGYVSFSGCNGVARYHGTYIEEVLPVNIFPYDDRVEITDGFIFNVINTDHQITSGIPWNTAKFTLCGYNKLVLKEGAKLLAEYNGDPFIACGKYKKGRTAVFASDFAPHWAGDFIDWEYYPQFWAQMVSWLAKK